MMSMKMIKILISLSFFIFFNTLVHSQSDEYGNLLKENLQLETNKESLEVECQQLIDSGVIAMRKEDYLKAISEMTKAELIAEKNQFLYKLWLIKNQIGYSYSNLSNYGEAFSYYNEALNIVKSKPALFPKEEEALVLNNLGLLYCKKNDREQALKYFMRAYQISEEKGLISAKKVFGVNIADSYNYLRQFDKAEKQLLEVESVPGSAYAINLWRVTYAETVFLKGDIEKAFALSNELFSETKETNTSICNICVLELLSKIYAKKGDLDEAISYTKSALKYNRELSPRIDRYNNLARLYETKGEYRTAIMYKDSVIIIKDSLTQKTNQQLYETTKIKLRINDYQNKVKITKKNYENKLRYFWIIGFSGLLLFIFIYAWQKNRIIKQNQKQVIIENTQKIIELKIEKEKSEHLLLENKIEVIENSAKLKQEKLKSKISKKNRELTANALFNSSRLGLLRKIIGSLEVISHISENQEIKNYIKLLKEHTKTNELWKEFTAHFEKVNPGFLQKIKNTHPKLTKTDIRFICYIYMNLNTKEVCIILNITPEAFWKRKQRLLEKLALPQDTKLYEYISQLENNDLDTLD